MGYGLGVDLGTTFTAAATFDDGAATMVGLGNRALQIPSVLYLRSGEPPLVGEAAERRGLQDPGPLVREFKRRFGDPVPVMVDGTPYSAPALTAHLLRWVLQQTTERMGAPPSTVVLTRPANWGEFKLDLLRDVARLADVQNALTCTEPEAAAIEYASRHRISPGEKLAIYDLGGGTFDICFFVRTGDGFQMVGRPDGIEQLGGVDFDEAVFQFVLGNAGLDLDRVDPADPEVVSAFRQLRRDCVDAKEALSQDVDTVVPVTIADLRTSVRVTRSDFEALIGPALDDTVRATQRGLRSSGLAAEEISAFVLVGGSSRIPLVSEKLGRAFHCTVARDTHPKHDIAMGAARVGSMPPMATELLPREPGRAARPAAAPPAGSSPAASSPAGVAAGGLAPGVDGADQRVPPPPYVRQGTEAAPHAAWPGAGGDPRQRQFAPSPAGPASGPGSAPRGPGGSGSRRRMWLIVAAVVGVVAAGSVAALLVLTNKGGANDAAEAPLSTGAASSPAAGSTAAGGSAGTGQVSPAVGTGSAGTAPVGDGAGAGSSAGVTSTGSAAPVALSIPATAVWTGTGVQCAVGSVVDIGATGSVLLNVSKNEPVGPDGAERPDLRKFNVKGLPDANHGALIGSIGGTQPYFVVGSSLALTCPAAGELFLGINDAGVDNNGGAFEASITRQAG